MYGRRIFSLLLVFFFVMCARDATAGPAAGFVIGFCPTLPPTCAVTPATYSGSQITLWIFAVDSTGGLATNYTGTVRFTSNDPNASLPPDHTFTTNENSQISISVTLHRVSGGLDGSFTWLYVTDIANPLTLTAGLGQVLIEPTFVAQAPALSWGAQSFLAFIVLALAVSPRRRSCKKP